MYPRNGAGYWADIERLGLDESSMGTSSVNPASLYGPDGVPYAPWMVGKVSEGPSKKRSDGKTEAQRKFEYDGRGQVPRLARAPRPRWSRLPREPHCTAHRRSYPSSRG